MANDSMGNLEKLGILVIVILVVVVGVVAITPSDTLFQPEPEPRVLEIARGDGEQGQRGDLARGDEGDALPSSQPGPSQDPWPDPWDRDDRSTTPGDRPAPLPAPLSVPSPPPVTPTPVSDPPRDDSLPPDVDPTPVPPVRVSEPPAPRAREYVVRSGDSLAKIAGRQSPPVRWVDIYRANPGIDPNMIKPGQVLHLPVVAATVAVDTVRREHGVTPPRTVPEPRDGGTTHVVAKGETLSAIAQRRLGKAAYWQRLYEANRDVISDPDRVPAGITLRLPSVASNGGRERAVIAGNAGTTVALPRFADAIALGDQDYMVERGDNLSRIAARFLGDADRWRDVFDANRDRLSDPSRLRAGMRIRIP